MNKREQMINMLRNDSQMRSAAIDAIRDYLSEKELIELDVLQAVNGYETGFVDFFAYAYGENYWNTEFYECIAIYLNYFKIESN